MNKKHTPTHKLLKFKKSKNEVKAYHKINTKQTSKYASTNRSPKNKEKILVSN